MGAAYLELKPSDDSAGALDADVCGRCDGLPAAALGPVLEDLIELPHNRRLLVHKPVPACPAQTSKAPPMLPTERPLA